MYGENGETIEEFSQVLFKLYKWLALSLDLRKNDVQRRRADIAAEKEKRQKAIEQAE